MNKAPADDVPFDATPAMRRYARACIARDVPGDEDARCKAAEVSPRAVRRWRSDARFAEWLRAEIERVLAENIWEVWGVVSRLALEGNLQAAKLHLARFDGEAARLARVDPETFQALAELADGIENGQRATGNDQPQIINGATSTDADQRLPTTGHL